MKGPSHHVEQDTQDKITRWMFVWPGTAGPMIHFTHGPGVESIPKMVCGTKAILANHSRVRLWGGL